MAALIDTQALVWIATRSPKLSRAAERALLDGAIELFVSAVTAFEFADLNSRGRFGADLPLDPLLDALGATLLDYPVACWRLIPMLPPLHRDPVDRMLITHAIHADLTLITAEATMHDYPVRTLW